MCTTNAYCQALDIDIPSLEQVTQNRDMSYYSQLVVVLLEHGGPVTLVQAARRISTVGGQDAASILMSLKPCDSNDGEVFDITD